MTIEAEKSAHSSALKFDYRIRPRKGIERKMLCESFQFLSTIHPLDRYAYIGFGAFYFADFKAVHRHLGTRNMLSIEGDSSIYKRVDFNRPYTFIKVKKGDSTDILNDHSWANPGIVWLDYDKVLKTSYMRDIDLVVANAPSGTVLLVTTDADPKALDRTPDAIKGRIDTLFSLVMSRVKDADRTKRHIQNLFQECGVGDVRLKRLHERLDGNVPHDVSEDDLTNETLPQTLRRLIWEEIQRQLNARNAMLPKERKIRFEQLYNFVYADGRTMLTYGGILVEPAHWKGFKSSGVLSLGFIRRGKRAFEINLPQLTMKEVKLLEDYVPRTQRGKPRKFELSDIEFRQYCKFYRYYPHYAEFDV